MKVQKQLFRHKPAEGIYGDCHRTAIACVLDMDAKDVPHFMDGKAFSGEAENAHDRAEAWLNARGIATINIVFSGRCSSWADSRAAASIIRSSVVMARSSVILRWMIPASSAPAMTASTG